MVMMGGVDVEAVDDRLLHFPGGSCFMMPAILSRTSCARRRPWRGRTERDDGDAFARGRAQFIDAGDRVDRLLDGLGDARFHFLGAGPRQRRGDGDDGEIDLGKQIDAELQVGEHAEDEGHGREDPGEDGPADENVGEEVHIPLMGGRDAPAWGSGRSGARSPLTDPPARLPRVRRKDQFVWMCFHFHRRAFAQARLAGHHCPARGQRPRSYVSPTRRASPAVLALPSSTRAFVTPAKRRRSPADGRCRHRHGSRSPSCETAGFCASRPRSAQDLDVEGARRQVDVGDDARCGERFTRTHRDDRLGSLAATSLR